MSNTFGRFFKVTTWGESHGKAIGAVVDGCPPGLSFCEKDVQVELDRRRPGQSEVTTPRLEQDKVLILSGVYEGVTLGTPISMLVWNRDARPEAYDELRKVLRPSHADYTYRVKYGILPSGGGRASARETIGRVAAGALARKILNEYCGVEIIAGVEAVHTIKADLDLSAVTRAMVESNPIRCPDSKTAVLMMDKVKEVKRTGDSVGGVVFVVAKGVPAGWGAPVFGKLDADFAGALMSIPAVKGVEVGSGFQGTCLKGSEHNDLFELDQKSGRIRTKTNRSGGIQGGISNGEDIVLRVAFKPTSTISKAQETVDLKGNSVLLSARGRHDPCVLPRAVPIVEAMVALVLVDHFLYHRGQCGGS